jgi:very-short-patch-repair endonuclease
VCRICQPECFLLYALPEKVSWLRDVRGPSGLEITAYEALAQHVDMTRVCTEMHLVRMLPTWGGAVDIWVAEFGLIIQVDGSRHFRPSQQSVDRRFDMAVLASSSISLTGALRLHWRDVACVHEQILRALCRARSVQAGQTQHAKFVLYSPSYRFADLPDT